MIPACRDCNRSKKDLSLLEWVQKQQKKGILIDPLSSLPDHNSLNTVAKKEISRAKRGSSVVTDDMKRYEYSSLKLDHSRQIGHGTFKTVYKIGNDTAVGVIRDRKHEEALSKEIEIMKKAKHRNVLEILGKVMDKSNLVGVAMPLCESSLRDLIKNGLWKRDPTKIIRTALDICRGLDQLARHGVVHRDLKSANILMYNGTPVIADFGHAKELIGDLHSTSVGTVNYCAPEILAKQRDYGPAVDVWSFAMIMWEMCSGQPPFSGKTETHILKDIERDIRPDWNECIDMPRLYIQLVQVCWRLQPQRRPNIGAVLECLDEIDQQRY